MKAERLRRGWTQTDLAYRSKVAISEISRFETQRAKPYPAQERRLSKILQLDPSTLLDEINSPSDTAA
jgi:transcriptional regulator with XRE-family HTH domain